jgi:hypothetical protein
MTTIATTFSRHIRRPGTAYQTFSRPGYMKRFCYFIERSDWDERFIAHEAWVNKICVGVIIASVIFFAPALIKIFLR